MLNLWETFPWVQPAEFASPIFSGTFWSHGRTNVAGFSRFGEVAQHSGLYEFHSCALCCEVSYRELFAKISSQLIPLGILFVQSLPKIHTIGQGSQTRGLGYFWGIFK